MKIPLDKKSLGIVALCIILASGILTAAKFSSQKSSPNTTAILLQQEEKSPRQNLHIGTFSVTETPTQETPPSNQPFCQDDSVVANSCDCVGGGNTLITCHASQCVSIQVPAYAPQSNCDSPIGGSVPYTLGQLCKDGLDALGPIRISNETRAKLYPNSTPAPDLSYGGPDASYCFMKPVIYLYPTKDTVVNVNIITPGIITESDPLYPLGGWKNVLAHPDGTLMYQNKNYHELFYETSATKQIPIPKQGIVVLKKDVGNTLWNLTSQLGLIHSEQQELVNFWVPRINRLQTPYVFISVFPNETKEAVDQVKIDPKPDTFIEFLLYFKGEENYGDIPELRIPETPHRVGFTAVEWGGRIDY